MSEINILPIEAGTTAPESVVINLEPTVREELVASGLFTSNQIDQLERSIEFRLARQRRSHERALSRSVRRGHIALSRVREEIAKEHRAHVRRESAQSWHKATQTRVAAEKKEAGTNAR